MTYTVVVVDDYPEVRTMVRIAFGLQSGLEIIAEADSGDSGAEIGRAHV